MIKEYKKMRADASVGYSEGNDGRDCFYYVEYKCPVCHKTLNHTNNSFCEQCGVLFDWSKKAHIKITRSIEWE